MQHSLADQSSASVVYETDVAIIGGGISGFVLAHQLDAQGVQCLIVESGGSSEIENDPLYSDIDFARRVNAGATTGRSRCLGGTSVKWGGALLPLRDADFSEREEPGQPAWPITMADVEAYIAKAEALFGLDHSPYETAPIANPSNGFIQREAKWPTFRKRNVTFLFEDMLNREDGPQVLTDATVREFKVCAGRLCEVTAYDQDNRKLTIVAKKFVISSGAIESTRLMQLLDAQTNGQVVQGRKHLGRYFQDHLSISLGWIDTKLPSKLNELFGFRFEGQMMRSLRFERDRPGRTAGYVDIAPKTLAPTGFEWIRDVMRAWQRGKFDVDALVNALRYSPYLLRMVWWRLVKKRLLWPKPATYEVKLVIEQSASFDSKIFLGSRTDKLGHPVAVLDWDVTPKDAAAFSEICCEFEQFWQASGLDRYGTLKWNVAPEKITLEALSDVEEFYHPVGTTRMATTSANGVVDSDLRVFGIDNLHISATSVFPTGGGANPTMTLILLSLRLADELAANKDAEMEERHEDQRRAVAS